MQNKNAEQKMQNLNAKHKCTTKVKAIFKAEERQELQAA